MKKSKFIKLVKDLISPTEIGRFYLGEEYKIVGDSLVYHSPLRERERTPSFYFNDEKGIHDFRNSRTLRYYFICSKTI